jgi:hypothetical protein
MPRQSWAGKDQEKLSQQLNADLGDVDDDDMLFDQTVACKNPDVDSDSETVKKECSSSRAMKNYWWVDEFKDYVNKAGDPEKCRVKPDEVRNTLYLYRRFILDFSIYTFGDKNNLSLFPLYNFQIYGNGYFRT